MAWIATILFFSHFYFFRYYNIHSNFMLFHWSQEFTVPVPTSETAEHYPLPLFLDAFCCIAFVQGPRETVPNPEEAIASLYFTDYPEKFGKKEPVAQQFLRELVYSWAVTQPSRCPTRGCLSRQTTTHRPTCDFVLITASMESLKISVSVRRILFVFYCSIRVLGYYERAEILLSYILVYYIR